MSVNEPRSAEQDWAGRANAPGLRERVLLCDVGYRCVHASPCTQLLGHRLDEPLTWELAGLPGSMADCLRTRGAVAMASGQPVQALIPGDSGSHSEGACVSRITPVVSAGASFLLLHLRPLTWKVDEDGLQSLAGALLGSDAFAVCTARLPDWRLQRVAKGLAGLLGIDAETLHGESLLTYFEHPGDPVGMMQAMACGRCIRNLEVSLVRASGDSVTALLSAIRFDDRGTPGVLLVFTELKGTDRVPQGAQHAVGTRLQTRRQFVDQIAAAMAGAEHQDDLIAVLFTDVVLDICPGYAIGAASDVEAKALGILGRRLEQAARGHEAVARIGKGFAVLLRRLHGREDAARAADRLRSTLGKPVGMNGGFIQVRIGIGIAHFPSELSSAAAVLEQAERAARASARPAKGSEGNTWPASDNPKP